MALTSRRHTLLPSSRRVDSACAGHAASRHLQDLRPAQHGRSLVRISVEVQTAATSHQSSSGATVFLLGVVSSVTNRKSRRSAQSRSSSRRVPGDPPATRSFVQPVCCMATSICSTAHRLSLPPQVSQYTGETGISPRVSPGDGRRQISTVPHESRAESPFDRLDLHRGDPGLAVHASFLHRLHRPIPLSG